MGKVKLQYPGCVTKSAAAINPCLYIPLPISHSWFVFLVIPSSWIDQWLLFDRMMLPREGRVFPALFKPEYTGLWGTVMIFMMQHYSEILTVTDSSPSKIWLWLQSFPNIAAP